MILSVSSENNTKILSLKKSPDLPNIVQEFLKDLGIKRDYRKDVFREITTDTFHFADNKDGSIKCSIFVGASIIFLQVSYDTDKEDKVLSLINQHFTK